MKNSRQSFIILALAVFSSACSSGGQKLSQDIAKEFKDNGKTADSLKSVFKCEAVTLDKWESSEVTDSTFSFCLINAKRIPKTDNERIEALKAIARSIRTSVKFPEKYKSYQIVFVKSDQTFWGGSQSHQYGGVVSNEEL